MFMHYYESGIIYSTDAGNTWTKWFDNLIVHYQGMLTCNDRYYLYSFEGDAFRPWMFGFDKNLLLHPIQMAHGIRFCFRRITLSVLPQMIPSTVSMHQLVVRVAISIIILKISLIRFAFPQT